MLCFKEDYSIAVWDRTDGEERQIPPSHGTITNSPTQVWDGFFCPYCYRENFFNWIDFDAKNDDPEEEVCFFCRDEKINECPKHGLVNYYDPFIQFLVQEVEKDIEKRRCLK